MIDSNIIFYLLPQHHPLPVLATSEINVHHRISSAYTASSGLPVKSSSSYSFVKRNAKMKQRVEGTQKEL